MDNQTIPPCDPRTPDQEETQSNRSYILRRYAERIVAKLEPCPLKESEEIILGLCYIRPRTMPELINLLPQYCQSCISRSCNSLVESGLLTRSGNGRNNNLFTCTSLAIAFEERMSKRARILTQKLT